MKAETAIVDSELNQAAVWSFKRIKKYARYGVERGQKPALTIAKVEPIMAEIGVTRIGNITHLDSIGIPTFTSLRPTDLGPGISYYNGKGSTLTESKAGAMMEALERYCGEYWHGERLFSSYKTLSASQELIHPNQLIAPKYRNYPADEKIEWVSGYDLLNNKTVYVPLNSVVCPYKPQQGEAIGFASTNGLASGNNMEEALCHALCEVVERDASAISLANMELIPTINNILHDLASHPPPQDEDHHHPLITLDKLPRRAALMVEKIKRSGLEVYVRDVTSAVGIATIDCTIIDSTELAHGGTGTHPDARVALVRAISEAAQSRLAHIQGGREDLPDVLNKRVPKTSPHEIASKGNYVPFSSINSVQNDYIDDDVRYILQRLKNAGLDKVIAFDMTHPKLNIPVVKIVIPNAETWSVYTLHTDRAEFGPRIQKMLRCGQ